MFDIDLAAARVLAIESPDKLTADEALYVMLADRLQGAMLRACLTRAQMSIVGDALLSGARELAERVERFSEQQRALALAHDAEEPEPAEEPEQLVTLTYRCVACQRDMGRCSPMPLPLAEHMAATFKCPGCVREGR